MDDHSESISLFSPTTSRTLWIIVGALGGLSLALNFWGWARRGYHWTTFLGPVGMLLLMTSYLIVRSHKWLCFVLQVIAAGLLIADLTLILRRW